MNTLSATKAWLVFGVVAISAAAGYGCSSTDASILGSKNDHLSGDGGDEDGGAVKDDDEDGGAQKEACGSGGSSCSNPEAICAYRIQDACSALGECVVPTDSACASNVRVLGCDCDGNEVNGGDGCDTAGLPSGYTRQPMSQRFEDLASVKPCTNGDQDGGQGGGDWDQDGGQGGGDWDQDGGQGGGDWDQDGG